MKTQFYFPAPVEVVKVTNENLADVAEWCGGKVASTESRRVPGRQDSYVWVPTPKGNSISWAFPGMYITKRMVVTVKDEMKATYAVFRRDYFSRNYFNTPTEATDKTWEKFDKQQKAKEAPKPAAPKPRETYKSKAELEAEAAIAIIEKSLLSKQEIMEFGKDANAAQDEVAPKPVVWHGHPQTETCQENDCTQYQQIEAIHRYSNPRERTEEKENDMEKNEHGVPILTEEEAAARKAEREAAQPQTIAPDEQPIIPEPQVIDVEHADDVEGDGDPGKIVDLTEEAPDAFAGGQVLEGGEIVKDDGFASELNDGTDEYNPRAADQS